MIGHSFGNMGCASLRVLGMPEKQITEVQAFAAGFMVFAILFLPIAVLANLK